jgi:hypothetical protein
MLAQLGVVAVVASAVTAAVLAGVGIGQGPTRSEGVSRVERSIRFQKPWESSCDGDACGIQILFRIPVTTPIDEPSVDLTLTVTLDYAISRGDAATAYATIDDGASLRLNPRGGFRLAPSNRRNSTTLTWQKRALEGAGHEYTFAMTVSPRDLNRNGSTRVRGRKLTVVVETWSAGS